MGTVSRRRQRRDRRLRTLLRRRRWFAGTSARPALAGIWDGALPGDGIAALEREARALWASSGGSSAVAKSFWVARGVPPTCALHAFADAVANAHFPDAREVAGAEVWVQYRDGSAATGAGLELHFDKDERALDADEDDWRHPLLATATYLLDGGAPLAVFETTSARAPPRLNPDRGWLVAPARGRHVAFAGDRLHGVPDELATATETRRERLSVLVNLWASAPAGLAALPPPAAAAAPPDLALRLDSANRVLPTFARAAFGDASLHELAEHRAGDTGAIPLASWRMAVGQGPGVLEIRYV